jgi:hypothetical protein
LESCSLSADGITLTASYAPIWINPNWLETFVVTVAPDWKSWHGTSTYNNGRGTQNWWGWR